MRQPQPATTFALAALSACLLAGCSGGSSSTTAMSGTSPGTPGSSQSTGTDPTTASGPTAAAGTAAVDVCSLMTAAQASSINAVKYGTATSASPANGFDTCTYKNMGGTDPVDIQDLTVTVISLAGCWPQVQQSDGPGTSISGLGDAAFGHSIGIDVKVGDRCLTVDGLTHAELQNHYDPDVAMAKIILGGLH